MAKTQYVDVPDELRDLQRGALEQRDRFLAGVMQGHKRLPSKSERRLLKRTAIVNSPMEGRGSLFKYLSPFWRALSLETKAVWKDAAGVSSLNGWQLFISDSSQRIKNDLSLDTPANELWQVRTGRIFLEGSAIQILMKQEHPRNYKVLRKIQGASWKSQVVDVAESFGLPLELQIRYKSNMTTSGGTQRLRYFALVWSSYQGQDTVTELIINLNPSTDWTLATVTLNNVIGHIISYTLFLEVYGYQGEMLFDNIRAVHSGSNWARDPRCDDISREFSGGFVLVAPFWEAVAKPDGASFTTVYPDAL